MGLGFESVMDGFVEEGKGWGWEELYWVLMSVGFDFIGSLMFLYYIFYNVVIGFILIMMQFIRDFTYFQLSIL